jgi:cell division protein ZapA (FtsZ GTPase activity inhibitor)
MSNYEYEDDDDDFTTDSSNDLVKQLRKAAKQKDKELQELRSQFESLSKGQRERAIKDLLASRGVNSKIASFIPQDIDPTEESLSKWLDDNGDVFGIESGQTQATPNVDPAQAAAYKRMTNTADSGASPEHNADIMQKLLNANSKEELDEVIRLSGL